MLDLIHHKFLKLNFLHKIRSYVAQESQYVKTQRPTLASKVHMYSWGFLELCTKSVH